MLLQSHAPIELIQLMVPSVERPILPPDWVALLPHFHALQNPQVPNLQEYIWIDEIIFFFDFIWFNAPNEMHITTL